MTRTHHFTRKQHAQLHLRSGGNCERCGARLKVGEGEADHILPIALGGESTLENAQLICKLCHTGKTADDVRRIRKADRQRDRHSGAMPKSKAPLPFGRNSPLKRKINGEIVRRENWCGND